MIKAKTVFIFLLMGFVVTAGLFGCVSQKRMAVVKTEPTCAEALAEGIQGLSDYEVSQILDSALASKDTDGCWIPIMKQSLSENRDIPHRHIVEAVKTFNKHRYEGFFHKAVHRYFANLAKNPEKYRPEDQRFLETYCSFLINNAENSRDKHLRQAKLFCRSLDQNLYARLFK